MANALEQLVIDSLIKGKAEGKAEGRAEGQREAILSVLGGRFGAVPVSMRQQVSSTSDHTLLQRLVVEAATAHTLEEFAEALSSASGS